MTARLSCIAVDLTPVLPGGENGGAKIFVLELLRQLAADNRGTRFLLLTHAASHDELAWLDGANVQRLLVAGEGAPGRVAVAERHPPKGMRALALRLAPYLPARLRGILDDSHESPPAPEKLAPSPTLLGANGVDLLFCPFTAPTYHQPDVPTVCTIYDLQYKTYPEFFSPEDIAYRERTFQEACRRASALSAISDYSRDSALAHGRIDADRVRTIHLRMATRMSGGGRAKAASVLARYGLAAGSYLLFPANFWKHKNHEMALTAFGIACRRGLPPQAKLVCTGAPGERQEWLARAAAALGLQDRVVFPGFIDEDALRGLLARSCGMVFPSLYEGFGMPVLEAMAAGVPVACSNSTALPEVAAGAALMFDPRIPEQIADCMVQLVTDAPARKRLVAAGRRRAREFADTRRMAREYRELFEFALAHHRQESALVGAYADGWSGPLLNLQVAPARQSRTVEFRLSAPEWLPVPSVAVHASLRGAPEGVRLTIERGTSGVLVLPVQPEGACYDLEFSPSFVLAREGLGPDERELAALIDTCSIVAPGGERIELFPAGVA